MSRKELYLQVSTEKPGNLPPPIPKTQYMKPSSREPNQKSLELVESNSSQAQKRVKNSYGKDYNNSPVIARRPEGPTKQSHCHPERSEGSLRHSRSPLPINRNT